MKIAALLPHHPQIGHRLVEKALTKKEIANLIDAVYRHCGQKATVIFADQIMAWASVKRPRPASPSARMTSSSPSGRRPWSRKTRELTASTSNSTPTAWITRGEKYNKVVDAWAKATDRVADEMMAEISAKKKDANGRELDVNSIYMMAHSGARGSQAQMKQLGGMRGLMARPSGEIIETAVISNFKEGLTVLEYFNSTHGARKGLADTALKTANSGYLTRRLVDVAQDCIITRKIAAPRGAFTLRAVIEGGDTLVSLGGRILGRSAAEDIKDPSTGEIIIPADTYLVENLVDLVDQAGVQSVEGALLAHLRSQGRHLRRLLRPRSGARHAVNIGEAVGVIAAQSIGEPGTQLTMRTFPHRRHRPGGRAVLLRKRQRRDGQDHRPHR